LAEAGYPDGASFPELALGQIEDWFVVGNLPEQLAEVGIRTRVVRLPFELADPVGSVDAWLWSWVADFPDPGGVVDPFLEQYQWRIYRDARIEALLKQARSLVDRDERLKIYREVERLWIGEQAALVPLQYDRRTSRIRPWIHGFWQNALVTSTFAEVVVRRPDSAPRPA
jgi:ABC-type transport system substrate-binding protein